MISEKAKQVLEPLMDDNAELLLLVQNSNSEYIYLGYTFKVLGAINGNKATPRSSKENSV
ncbi:hypothetical protein IGI03_21590 [Bacillus thuringiensis]|uniref:hypothetical protein n=1 Tax=Bacillus thuringiensis TaxID=1428 RepID=UPI001873D4B7|nr:hypothetical protein [Bacillus thuringiensis]MBE5090619.1 hypothetical protein [Bacillus thuringiensis]